MAPCTVHVRVDDSPGAIDKGLALKDVITSCSPVLDPPDTHPPVATRSARTTNATRFIPPTSCSKSIRKWLSLPSSMLAQQREKGLTAARKRADRCPESRRAGMGACPCVRKCTAGRVCLGNVERVALVAGEPRTQNSEPRTQNFRPPAWPTQNPRAACRPVPALVPRSESTIYIRSNLPPSTAMVWPSMKDA